LVGAFPWTSLGCDWGTIEPSRSPPASAGCNDGRWVRTTTGLLEGCKDGPSRQQRDLTTSIYAGGTCALQNNLGTARAALWSREMRNISRLLVRGTLVTRQERRPWPPRDLNRQASLLLGISDVHGRSRCSQMADTMNLEPNASSTESTERALFPACPSLTTQ